MLLFKKSKYICTRFSEYRGKTTNDRCSGALSVDVRHYITMALFT